MRMSARATLPETLLVSLASAYEAGAKTAGREIEDFRAEPAG